VIVERLGAIIADLAGEIPILLAEQNAVFALTVAQRGYVVEKGRIRFAGDRDELRNNREVQDRYLTV
jgi:branched-chain amino acid transport system ATP-binding protein